jgi:hypothetical protein
LARGEQNLHTFLPAEEPARSRASRALAQTLAALVDGIRRKALLIARVDGVDAEASPLATSLRAAGFTPGVRGYLKRAPIERSGAAIGHTGDRLGVGPQKE